MYHPYFRGRQYELLTIRENAELIANKQFSPIIEPVRKPSPSLERALSALEKYAATPILIANPSLGEYSKKAFKLKEVLPHKSSLANTWIGVLLNENAGIEQIRGIVEQSTGRHLAFIHAGYMDGAKVLQMTSNLSKDSKHIFLDNHNSNLYRRKFKDQERVLVKDGFHQRRNRDYPEREYFSDLHAVYQDEGMNGFGDFLIVGGDYSDKGGPAYAVAIHITYIDTDADDEMKVLHFVSDRRDTPTDPAGKFLESLEKLISVVDQEDSKIFDSKAIQEFKQLYESNHYPGLGIVKKLSMQHHLETLANYLP